MSTPDQLTLSKVASIIARGYKPTGLVLTSPDGKEVCIVDQSAVRWLDAAEMQIVMNPPCTVEAHILTYVGKEKPTELKNEKLAGEFTLEGLRAELKKRGILDGSKVNQYHNDAWAETTFTLTHKGEIKARWTTSFRTGYVANPKCSNLEFFAAETAKEGGK